MNTRSFVLVAALATMPAAVVAQAPHPHVGRDLAASCAICHGTDGFNAGGLPHLGGQPPQHLARQLRDFRDGRRAATIMHQITRGLTEEQIDAVSAHWAAQKISGGRQ